MASRGAEHRRPLVVVDSRPPGAEPLASILIAARKRYAVEILGSVDRVLVTIARIDPAAILVHADIGRQTGLPPAGPLIAALCRREHSATPVLLYRALVSSACHEALLAQLGFPAPVVIDRRLAGSLEETVADLVERTRLEALQRAPAVWAGDVLPERFRVDRHLEALERALLGAALEEHPDRAAAAAAVCMPIDAFEARLDRYDLQVPRERRPESIRGASILCCARGAPPPSVTELCDALDVGLRAVVPGLLHPGTVACTGTVAAVVDPADAATVADLWLLDRSIHPVIVLGSPPAPVRLALEALDVRPCWVTPGVEDARCLLRLGECVSRLHRDERLRARLAFRRDGQPAWPLDVPSVLARVDGRTLRFAYRLCGAHAKAAEAVGLSERTFRRRLKKGAEA